MKKMIELWNIYQQQGIEIWLDKFNKEYGQYTDNQLRYSSLLIFSRPDMPGRTISYYNNLYITNFITIYAMANREEKNKIEEVFSSQEEFKTIIEETIAEEQYLQILF
ncbi:MAG: hypothetical protein LUH15_05960 [Tannerellaceae bacterium]|nr:hypothetical protein [Tannerellaceae bacterium]